MNKLKHFWFDWLCMDSEESCGFHSHNNGESY